MSSTSTQRTKAEHHTCYAIFLIATHLYGLHLPSTAKIDDISLLKIRTDLPTYVLLNLSANNALQQSHKLIVKEVFLSLRNK